MNPNSQKWSQKCYHSLPFAAKVSVRRSFEQFHNLNKGQAIVASRINHIPPWNLYKWKVFLTACRNTAAYCIFLPFGTPDSGSKFRRYQVFIRYHWASAGMTKGNRLSKRKRNVLRRDDYFYFHHYSFQICITDQAWGQYDWIYGQIPFLHFARLCRSPLFFLVGYAMRLRRLLRDLMHWSSLCSLLRTYERSTCSKSSILFTETKSRPIKKRTTPISSYLDQRSLVNKGFILWPYFRGFDSQRFVLLAVTVFIRICA